MNTRNLLIPCILMLTLLGGCLRSTPAIKEISESSPSIEGKQEFLDSPFVTAGNRVYMVGQQNGSFAELGWHIPGEMDGIWNHPVKLMDGFTAAITVDGEKYMLDSASSFTNYPYMNKHEFSLEEAGLHINRWQYVPDDEEGIGILFELENTLNEPTPVTFRLDGFSDLRPVWLGERTGMIDSPDLATYDPSSETWVFKDSLNSWFAVFGSSLSPSDYFELDSPFQGTGTGAGLSYELMLKPGETLTVPVVIAGSYNTERSALTTYSRISSGFYKGLIQKRNRYQQLADQTKLDTPDDRLDQTFEWLKYNSDWLIREVPEIGTGIGAGIPDYPWWFGVDSEYALKGYMAVGQEEAVYNTIDLIHESSVQENGNGRIIHEMSTNGAVFNPGNINETPQFASLIWEIYTWNGSEVFLKRYFPTIQQGLEWLMKENDSNNNLFPDGFGMMEIHGLNSEMIDVASYTQRAFEDASKIAAELGMQDLSLDYAATASLLKEKINAEFWSEEFNSFADFIGTDEQAIHLIDDAVIRADSLNKPWAVQELRETRRRILNDPSHTERPFVVHHNWVVNTPMEMGIADTTKAIQALETAKQFVNPFGVFVTGIDRDESAGSDDGSFKGSKVFSYTGAVMTLPTGVQAIAENNYGRPDEALDYLNRMNRTFSFALPGSMYEVSPDYGMMTQAWNIYSYAIPIVQQFFGVKPMASKKEITIDPQMPSEWDHASLENVKIAGNEIDLYYTKEKGQTTFRVQQTNADWTIHFIKPDGEKVSIKTDSFSVSW